MQDQPAVFVRTMKHLTHCALFSAVILAGCAEFDPGPTVEDLQLTIDALKTQTRDAQRTVADLRAELETRRQELGAALVARAQLEGKLRETERRFTEARQVVELQREELARARDERAGVAHGGRNLRSQLRQLQQQLAQHDQLQQQMVNPSRPQVRSRAVGRARQQEATVKMAERQDAVRRAAVPAARMNPSSPTSPDPAQPVDDSTAFPLRKIVVKPGDTLWSLARRYRVDLMELRILNQLTTDRILAGQDLFLPPASGDAG